MSLLVFVDLQSLRRVRPRRCWSEPRSREMAALRQVRGCGEAVIMGYFPQVLNNLWSGAIRLDIVISPHWNQGRGRACGCFDDR